MPSLAELIDNYLAGPRNLRSAVAGLTRDQLLARPIPGKWSTLEELLTTAANHIPHHVKFIADKRRALGLPA